MNEAIELHDSELAAMTLTDETVVLSFHPAYVHRSAGRPGFDPGSGWSQDATITILGAGTEAFPNLLPAVVSAGFLRVASHIYENVIPAPANFAAAVVFNLALVNGESITVSGRHITIVLSGSACYIEEFEGVPNQ
jgi:hypothetical protein